MLAHVEACGAFRRLGIQVARVTALQKCVSMATQEEAVKASFSVVKYNEYSFVRSLVRVGGWLSRLTSVGRTVG